MEASIENLYSKLNEFISKYHWYRMIKGFFLLVVLFLFVFIVQSTIEYFNYLSIGVKTFLFYFTLLFSAILLIIFVFIPLASIINLRKRINFKQASFIISKHFPEIKDKLINTLELSEAIHSSNYDQHLLIASINQRILQLDPIPFRHALNFSFLKRNFFLFLLSIFVLMLVFAFNPKIVTEGSDRLFHYSRYYEPESPFRFIINENDLFVEKNKDFTINLKVDGDYLPENVYLTIGNNQFLMAKEKRKGMYSFVLRNIYNSLDFRLFADKYYSKNYKLSVIPSPVIRSLMLDIFPPANTGFAKFRILNSGDCNVPSGSTIKWTINTSFVDNIEFIVNTDTSDLKGSNEVFEVSKQIRSNSAYQIQYFNQYFRSGNILKYNISVTPDLYPEIEFKQIEDSASIGSYFFVISIRDDYGFKDLKFIQNLRDANSDDSVNLIKIKLNPNEKSQDIFFNYDFNELKSLMNDDIVEYYFEIRDNDFLNGYKVSKTSSRIFKLLNKDEVRKSIDEVEKDRNNALAKSKKLTDDIQKEIDLFKKKELNNEVNEWDKKNFLKNITEKQKALENQVEDLLDKNKRSNQMNNQFYEEQKNIIEKQKKIQEILDQIMDEELKKLLKEIEELSQKFNEQQFEKIKEKMEFSYENLEKKLDRSLELLKRYQVEENVLKISENIQELSELQKSLTDEALKKEDREEMKIKQEKLQKEFNAIENEFKETIQKNEDLKSPYNFEKFDQDFKQNEKQFEEIKQGIPSENKKKVQQKQQKLSDDLSKMAESMKDMFNEMEQNSLEMDIGDLRQIIDNLSIFSFNQEDIFSTTSKNMQNSPEFVNLISKQAKLEDDFKLIDDSIQALMSKVPQLGDLMLKETQSLGINLKKTNKLMEQRNRKESLKLQRFILNSANTLSLILSELKDQLENQMQSSGSGKPQKKNKPQQAMQDLKLQQQKLKQELEKLLNEMKKNDGKINSDGINEQIVKTLAEQEIFNKMLNDFQNQKGINPETDKKLKEIKNLSDQNIEDLINKKISPELFNRNQKILTRLLDSEKSEQEREQEKKRESKEGVKKEFIIPEDLRKSLEKEKSLKETLKKSNLNMKNYYNNLSNEYFRNLSN